MWLGPAISEFDVLNYHIYSPWAFLNNRYNIDLIPCGIRSYFNPFIDMPFYLLLKYFNNFPRFIMFLQGFWYGGIIFCAYKLATLFEFNNVTKNALFRISTIIITAVAPIIFYEAGTCFNDLITGVFICSALYLYLKVLFDKDSISRTKHIIISSGLLGLIAGLKLTSCIMIFAEFITTLCLLKNIDKPLKIIRISILGFITSFFVFNGYWYYKMWITFKNPIFPYMNNIFHSPYGGEYFIINESYTLSLPQNIIDKFTYIFTHIKNFGTRDDLINYTDFRYIFGTICAAFMLIKLAIKKFKIESKNDKTILFFIIFTISTYIAWLNLFATVRYIIPIIVLLGIIIIYTIFIILTPLESNKLRVIILSIILLLYCSSLNIDYDTIREEYQEKLINNIDYHIENDSLVIMATQATSYAIPQLNSNAKYCLLIFPISMNKAIKDYGNFIYNNTRNIDYYYSTYYETKIKDAFTNTKNIYIIYTRGNNEDILINRALKKYNENRWVRFHKCQKYYYDTTICKISKF